MVNDSASTLARMREEWASGWCSEALSLRIADTIGCAVGGRSSELWRDLGTITQLHPGTSPVWGTSSTASVHHAALRNGTAVRCLDFSDTYLSVEAVHPSDVIAPVLAAASQASVRHRRVLEAVNIAYESVCRLADVLPIRTAGLDGVTLVRIAVANGVSWLLGLDVDAARQAVGIACARGAELLVTRLGALQEWKNVAGAAAGADGIQAVEAARAGIRGPERPFESSGGLFDLLGGGAPVPTDSRSRVSSTIIKRYPAQIFVQAPIAVAEELSTVVRAEDVARVEIRTFRYAVASSAADSAKWHPVNRATADHSLPYCFGLPLVLGGFDWDLDRHLDDQRLLDLMSRITVLEDPDATARYPAELRYDVDVVDRRGGSHSVQRRATPYCGVGEVAEKFQRLGGSAEQLASVLSWRLRPSALFDAAALLAATGHD